MNPSQNVSKSRRGMTLIELMVVLGVISIMSSMLLPAVQQAREAARRIQCRNHLKQLGLALHNYHDTHAAFPPGSLLGNIHNINEMLLPFLDQSAVFHQLNFSLNNLSATNADVLLKLSLPVQTCPSNPAGAAIGGYDGLWAQGAAYQTCAGPYRYPLGADTTSDCKAVGQPSYCFGPQVTRTSGIFSLAMTGTAISSRISEVTDGTSQTILMGEVLPQLNLFHGLWSAQAYGFITSMKPNSQRSKRPATSMIPAVSYQDALNLNHGLFSAHDGGVHVLLADGSVRFISDTIDFATYNFLGSKSDGQIVSF
ncbi:DUF1559 domain-containing protein [Planctomicrobium sp. SH661]|uniref:DUF1559 family PulG-like putative transporter n=1 Tax=Planctomicrobium sp. SH661 TaxID=3448124 RepID=UPI003F5BB3F0